MKKVVVVVSSSDRMCFTGDDLVVIDTDNQSSVGKLIIKRKGEKETLAVFSVWRYWFRIEDETLDKTDKETLIEGDIVELPTSEEHEPDKDAEKRIIEKRSRKYDKPREEPPTPQ